MDEAIDTTVLISDLSHQLEEARVEIETLKAAMREARLTSLRAEGARDALRDVLTDLYKHGR